MLGSRLAPKVSSSKPRAGAPLDESLSALLASALSGEHKSADTYKQDIVDAFESVPKAQLEQAAAVCRDLGNEAVKNERWEEAHERYTSVLAAFPHDHEVLANRSMCALHRGELEAAVTDAALAVNLAPNVPKGFYRLGCALEACKMYKESATVFAKVVELEPDNVAASARLLKARQLLEMCLNVERVNDPLWMHKPPPEKTPLQARAEEAAARSDGALGARRQQMRMARFDHEYLTLPICAEDRSPTQQEEIYLANGPFLPYVGPRFCHISGFHSPQEEKKGQTEHLPLCRWYKESAMAKGLHAHLKAHSAVMSPRRSLLRLADAQETDALAECVRRAVPRLVPAGGSGVVLLLGGRMGLLPTLSLEAGANVTYVVEPYGFCAKLAPAQVARHALMSFERDHWSRMPLSAALLAKVRAAAKTAHQRCEWERAAALYTEALGCARELPSPTTTHPAPPTKGGGEQGGGEQGAGEQGRGEQGRGERGGGEQGAGKGGDAALCSALLANRSLSYLRMGLAESALADAQAATTWSPEFAKGYYRAAQALESLGRRAESAAALHAVLRLSKGGKNADAEAMLARVQEGAEGGRAPPTQTAVGRGASGGGDRPPHEVRSDRAQRLSVAEVNAALSARCEKVRAVHAPYDRLRLHHELAHRPELVVWSNYDYTLLGLGAIPALNRLKAERLLREDATVLPAAARLWVMAVEHTTDVGVPLDMGALDKVNPLPPPPPLNDPACTHPYTHPYTPRYTHPYTRPLHTHPYTHLGIKS